MWRRFFFLQGYNRPKRLESGPTHPNYNVFTTRRPPSPKFFSGRSEDSCGSSPSLLYENVPGDLFLHESRTSDALREVIFMSFQTISYIHIVLKDEKSKILDQKVKINSIPISLGQKGGAFWRAFLDQDNRCNLLKKISLFSLRSLPFGVSFFFLFS